MTPFTSSTKFLALILILALCGCQSVEETKLQRSISESIARETQGFMTTDAREVVAARLKAGNTKFLGYSGVPSDPVFVPGLSPAQIQQLTQAKRYQWEVFYYYHGRIGLGSPAEEKTLWDARIDYAERVNRLIFEAIGRERTKS